MIAATSCRRTLVDVISRVGFEPQGLRRRWIAPTLVVALTVMVALTACGRTPAATGPTATSDPLGLTVIPEAEREQAPAVAGKTLDDGELDLADMRGTPIVVNSWASWCDPCELETPLLVDLASRFPDISFVGVNVQDREPAAREFDERFAVPYPSIVDPQSRLLASLPGVPPRAVPSTIVIDAQGRVAARVVGPVDATNSAQFEELLTSLRE